MTYEGRFRVWLEVWMLDYFGRRRITGSSPSDFASGLLFKWLAPFGTDLCVAVRETWRSDL